MLFLKNLYFFQYVLALIALFFLLSGIIKFAKKEKNQTFFKFMYTVIIWGGILFLSIFPDSLRSWSMKWGLGENLNTLIFIGFVLVFVTIFKLLSIIEKNERNITEIVRKQALQELDFYIAKEKDKNNPFQGKMFQ